MEYQLNHHRKLREQEQRIALLEAKLRQAYMTMSLSAKALDANWLSFPVEKRVSLSPNLLWRDMAEILALLEDGE